ncbi:MAG: hypothetical protein J6W28_06010 [Clostridia bacterium]|nr:hypothetical protein [Clostridia bacterium]
MENKKPLPAVMALAYLGDAVYSLYVRRRLVEMGVSHAGDLNRLSLSFVPVCPVRHIRIIDTFFVFC